MSSNPSKPQSLLPSEEAFKRGLAARHRRGEAWKFFYYFSIAIAILALIVLFLNVINEAFGTIATEYEVQPEEVAGEGRSLQDLTEPELVQILLEYVPNRMPVIVRNNLSQVEDAQFVELPLAQIIPGGTMPEEIAAMTVNEVREDFENANEIFAQLLSDNLSVDALELLVREEVLQQRVVASYPLFDTIFNYDQILADIQEDHPDAEVTRFYSWLSRDFLTTPMSSTPANAGIRTAVLGSLYMMLIVVIVALPIGVGAAIYLNEYATDNFLNRLIETNVRNLAGVPSIIYGMLGLAIFARVLAPVTAGQVFGYNLPELSKANAVQVIGDSIGYEQLPDSAWPFLVDNLRDDRLERVLSSLNDEQRQRLVNNISGTQLTELQEEFEDITLPAPDDVELAVPENRLTEAELDALSEEFLNYRRPNLLNVSPPTTEDFRRSINRAIDETKISEDEYDTLVRALEQFSRVTINGRTILSAALTLALLILPIIIISAQEALRAVPYTVREASYGLGATKWQTIWRQVLPAAVPGILTGTILAVSRAIGETAPLIVVGASTFIVVDPSSPFSKFTALPIQIYQWTARPQDQYRDIAAAAIIVLLVLMLTLNALAIILRNRFSIRY